MSLADEIRKLQELHRSGALSDREFSDAKAALLAGAQGSAGGPAPALQKHLQEIQIQNEIARIDREWEIEQQNYMMSGKYGQRYIPSRSMSVIGGVLVAGFGIFWTMMAASMGAPFFFPLFGVVFILIGVGTSIYAYAKAGEYERAHGEYLRRRSNLLSGPVDSIEPTAPYPSWRNDNIDTNYR